MKYILYIYIIFSLIFIYPSDIKKNHIDMKYDKYNRKYGLKWDGSIVYNVDIDYYSVVPNLEDLQIHFYEAGALDKNSLFIESIKLRKNIDFCSRLLSEDETYKFKDLILENSKSLGSQLSIYSQRLKSDTIDPNFCYKDDNLYMNSMEYSIRAIIPNIFTFDKSKPYRLVFKDSDSVKLKILKFQSLDEESVKELNLENALDEWKSLDTQKVRLQGNLIIAMSKHFKDSINPEFLNKFWEQQRGITANRKKILEYSVKFEKNQSMGEYTIKDENREIRMIEYQLFLISKSIGVTIIYFFPESKIDKYKKAWSDMKENLFFRGLKFQE